MPNFEQFDADEKLELGSGVMYEALIATYCHKKRTFDVPGYIAGFQVAEQALLERSEPPFFVPSDIESCLMDATKSIEDYADILHGLELEDQFEI